MPPPSEAPTVSFVDDPAGLDAALADLDVPVVGVDVERSDSHRYFRVPALVQVGAAGRCVLVDSIAMDALPALHAFLAERTAVLHALDNDLTPLAAVGVTPPNVTDTAIAAALLGLPTGLGPLQTALLGLPETPDKERMQRADWTTRPLTGEMVTYAAGDVVHLPELWVVLTERLDAAGRRGWYEEELAHIVLRDGTDRRAWTRTKGAGRLGARAKAILRALWEEREAIARSDDVAPQRLARDELLVTLAADPPSSVRELLALGMRKPAVRDYGHRLIAAARRGENAPAETGSGGLRRATDLDREAYDLLRKVRTEVAKSLDLDPGLLCPSRPLWRAILLDPETPEQLCGAAELRGWQTSILALPLWDALTGLRAAAAADEDAADVAED